MAYYPRYNRDLNQQPEETDVSKINAAGLINLRVQESWGACRRNYNNGEYDELRDELSALWPEFYADATKEQKEELKEIDKAIATATKNRNASVGKRKQWLYFNIKYKHAVYQKWLFLKLLEKGQGVGKAYIDKDADDWD